MIFEGRKPFILSFSNEVWESIKTVCCISQLLDDNQPFMDSQPEGFNSDEISELRMTVFFIIYFLIY